jgi:hypothetical protein
MMLYKARGIRDADQYIRYGAIEAADVELLAGQCLPLRIYVPDTNQCAVGNQLLVCRAVEPSR